MIFCFAFNFIEVNEMNEKVNKFLFAEHKSMPKMHLKQSGFTFSTCGPFLKIK